MLKEFDHVSAVVLDAERTASDYRQLGFHVINRMDLGILETENRLVCFGDGSYFELLSFKNPSRASANRWWHLLAKGEGWADYSIHTDNIELDMARLKRLGVPMVGPQAAGKTRHDGHPWEVRWLLLGRGVDSPVLPFLIEDLTPHEIRVPPPPTSVVQAGGVPGIAGVTLLTADLKGIEGRLTALFGGGAATTVRQRGVSDARLFYFGDRWVEVIQVGDEKSEVADYARERGEGVYEITLGTFGKALPGTGTLLPLELTHAARIIVAK
jgi:catechol 2,3-dioxygenase-like lactoylglutathione lyase family enzyme